MRWAVNSCRSVANIATVGCTEVESGKAKVWRRQTSLCLSGGGLSIDGVSVTRSTCGDCRRRTWVLKPLERLASWDKQNGTVRQISCRGRWRHCNCVETFGKDEGQCAWWRVCRRCGVLCPRPTAGTGWLRQSRCHCHHVPPSASKSTG